MIRSAAVLTLAILAGGAAHGAETASAPATASATTQATQASFDGNDWTSPAKAVASYYLAMAKADGMGITQSVAWKDAEDGRRIAGSMIWVNSDKKLREIYAALTAAFPKDALVEAYVKKNVDDLDAREKRRQEEIERTLNQVREGKIEINGNSATVRPKGHEMLTLMKVDNQWKILPDSLEAPYGAMNDGLREEMAASAARAEKMRSIRTSAYDKYIHDLRLKKYGSGAAAIDARGMVELEIARKAAEEK